MGWCAKRKPPTDPRQNGNWMTATWMLRYLLWGKHKIERRMEKRRGGGSVRNLRSPLPPTMRVFFPAWSTKELPGESGLGGRWSGSRRWPSSASVGLGVAGRGVRGNFGLGGLGGFASGDWRASFR